MIHEWKNKNNNYLTELELMVINESIRIRN